MCIFWQGFDVVLVVEDDFFEDRGNYTFLMFLAFLEICWVHSATDKYILT
jgi:hypothetical protein